MGIGAKQTNGPDYWSTIRQVFEHDLETLPLNRFRHWASCHNVPLITRYQTWQFLGAGFEAARQFSAYHEALKENWIGVIPGHESDLRLSSDFDTSMQRVQDVAHLHLCDFTPYDFEKYNTIVEIGGGYGDMCSVIHNSGFKGKYTIYDFPEINKIQEYYLTQQGINANLISDPSLLEPADLVIATWSLSEIPIEEREPIMSRIIDSKDWLVMYQDRIFGTVSNTTYFKDLFGHHPKFMNLNHTAYDGENTYMVVINANI